MRASFDAWDNAGKEVTFVEEAGRSAASAIDELGGNRLNQILWVDEWENDSAVLALTLVTYLADGEIVEADMILNPNVHWGDGDSNSHDVQNAITHEVGHLLGLGHSEAADATMFASTPLGETEKRSLASDDLDGYQFIYNQVVTDSDREAADSGSGGGFGCSVADTGTRSAAPWTLVLVIGLLSVVRRAKLAAARAGITKALGALVVLAAANANAASIRSLSVEQLVSSADQAVRGTVVHSHAVKAGNLIYTDTVVTVDECLAGSCDSTSVIVRQLGGEVDGVGLKVSGSVSLAASDKVVLFLRATRVAGVHRPVGMAQGIAQEKGPEARLTRDLDHVRVVGPEVSFPHSLEALRTTIKSIRR